MPKPPDILHLYRDYGQHAIPITETEEKECMVSLDTDELEQKMMELDRAKRELVGIVVHPCLTYPSLSQTILLCNNSYR